MAQSGRPRPLSGLIFLGLCVWGAWATRLWLNTEDALIPIMFAVLAVLSAIQLSITLLLLIPRLFMRAFARKASTRAGSAGWAPSKDLRKKGLYKKTGFFVGVDARGKPVFVNIESSGLVLDAAGGGKTTGFIVPALCHCPDSMLVLDFKSTLATMTAALRRKFHKHKTICINPSAHYTDILGAGARYNPLQILIDQWADSDQHSYMFADAQGLAKQLSPDPAVQSENQYFRNGSRKILHFVFLFLVITGANPTLSHALSVISDRPHLQRVLQAGARLTALEGDLARLAKDLLGKFEKGDPKQMESFREGAVQALEPYSPSGVLAECTSYSDFRFSDLRDEKLTIYLMGDPTRKAAFDQWMGLMSWCAMTELLRARKPTPVVFLCDEVTNMKLEGLPSFLTLAREFSIRIWLVMQELEEWSKLYGRESLDTLLSQTEVKIMSASSYKTSKLISDMVGETTVKALSHNMGSSILDEPSASLSETTRRVSTPDEVRRSCELIVFVRKMRPIRVTRLGYHEIKPWASRVSINPLYGKPFKGKIRLKL